MYRGSVYARGVPAVGDSPIILSKTSGKVTGTFASDYEPAFGGASMYTIDSGNLVASADGGSD